MMIPHQPTTFTHCDTYVHHPPHACACIPTQLCNCCLCSPLLPVRVPHAPGGQRPLHDAMRPWVELQRPHCNSPQGLHRAPVPRNAPQRGAQHKPLSRQLVDIAQRFLWHPRFTGVFGGSAYPPDGANAASCWGSTMHQNTSTIPRKSHMCRNRFTRHPGLSGSRIQMLSASSFTLPAHKRKSCGHVGGSGAPLSTEFGYFVCTRLRFRSSRPNLDSAAGLMACRHIPLQSTPRSAMRR